MPPLRLNARILKQEPAVQTADFGAAFAEYRNGTYTIEAHVLTQVDCIRAPMNLYNQHGMFVESCNASLRVIRTPKGQLAGVMARFDTDHVGAYANDQWVTRYPDRFPAAVGGFRAAAGGGISTRRGGSGAAAPAVHGHAAAGHGPVHGASQRDRQRAA